jgi:hypothetical protein
MDPFKNEYPEFSAKLAASKNADLVDLLPPAMQEDIDEIESKLGIPLPESYKTFLKCTRGFRMFDGDIEFAPDHPFIHKYPAKRDLDKEGRRRVIIDGGVWPPPSDGQMCFATYSLYADGDEMLFDVSNGLIEGEYPVLFFSHASSPPFVSKQADSFAEWLTGRCLDNMDE